MAPLNRVSTSVFPSLKRPPFFAIFSLMLVLIEKKNREMILDIDRVIEFIIPHKFSMSFCIGWD